jgi:spore germination protein GerM
VAVDREISLTLTPAQDVIRLLIKGDLTDEESDQGISTEFPLSGLQLEGAELENGVLTLNFSDPENATSGGACRVNILWAQIEATALQFDTVDEVRFSPETLFQP